MSSARTAGADSRVPLAKSVSAMYVHAVSPATAEVVTTPSRRRVERNIGSSNVGNVLE